MAQIDIGPYAARVAEWRESKGLHDTMAQHSKLASEVGELGLALGGRHGDVADEWGDCLFVLLVLADLEGIDIEKALSATVAKVERRRGWVVAGLFVMEGWA